MYRLFIGNYTVTAGIFCYIWGMSEPSHKYPYRVAKTIVEQAIVFGMPVPKVESMYEYAKNGANDAVSKTEYATEEARNAAYFTLLRRFFKAGLKKYSSKMPELDRTEVREILTRNRDKLIEGLTKNDTDNQGEGTAATQEGK